MIACTPIFAYNMKWKNLEKKDEKHMIRFILTCIVVIGFLVLSIPVLIAEWIIGKFSPQTRDTSSLKIVLAVFRLCIRITGSTVTVIGEENVPRDTPVLYIANHRSFFDVLLTYVRVPRCTGYIAKYEMKNIPLLNCWMRYLHCIFLNREDIRQGMKSILEAAEEIKRGVSICIFPEGTRTKDTAETEMLPFHKGSFKIASKARCPIVPIALTNTSAIFEDHLPLIKPAHVTLEYGKPIYPDTLDKEDQKNLERYTQNVILEMLRKNQK